MSKRAFNAVWCAISLVLFLAIPVRNLFFRQPPPGNRGDAFTTASWIMFCVLGALVLVFGVRVIRGWGKSV